MGTPEDVAAEKFFTPPTLTEMLGINLNMEPENDDQARAIEDTLDAIKTTFKEWLRTVGLPDYFSIDLKGDGFNTTKSLRQLLLTLVDEPEA